MNDQVIDYFQPDFGGKKKRGTTLGIVGMCLAIVGLVSALFTSSLYFQLGFAAALLPGIISLTGLGLSIAGKIISSGIGFGNGYGLAGIIIAPFGVVVFLVMFGISYQMAIVINTLERSMYDNSWSSDSFDDKMKEDQEKSSNNEND
ncbi:MAG: hypothetical protein ACI9J3_001221 [Parvicellaceae bacterium]|jgi:hypothetical protein